MGIGSDGFERRFAHQLAVLRAGGEPAGVIDGVYVHDPLGIGFALPPRWIERDPDEIRTLSEGMIMNSHDPVFNEAFRILAKDLAPLVTVSPLDPNDPIACFGPFEVAPLVALRIEEPFPEVAEGGVDLWKQVAINQGYWHQHVEDFRFLVDPKATTVSGCHAITFWSARTMLHMDAVGGCPVRERACYVLQDGTIFVLSMCDYPEFDPGLRFDYDDFLEGVCFR